MILWMLALMLVAAVAAVGYYQGAVRAVISFAGIVLGLILALPLGNLVYPLVTLTGVKHPVLLAVLGPVTVFILVQLVFAIAGFFVHHKIYMYYKHRTGDTLFSMWERMNQRLGICVGVLNGAIYVVALSVLIYVVGYGTVQVTTPGDSFMLRAISSLSQDLHNTGMIRATSRFIPASETYYDSADVLGIIYNNPLVQNRLSRYPTLVMLAETKEFQELGGDKAFQESWARQPTLREFTSQEKVRALLSNIELYSNTVNTVQPDIKDLKEFLVTGKSAKYDDEKILGRWDFDVRATLTMARKKPNVTTVELKNLRKALSGSMARATFMATLDKKAILKNPKVRYEGTWRSDGINQYKVSLKEGNRKHDGTVTVEGNRLLYLRDGFHWIFEK